ncbi:MAG TPA: putative toxin-antitoxin system toxin component, PIN family [Terriglobales bacterium]|jgi:putative PIN family toxin of toxin-antitoxin system
MPKSAVVDASVLVSAFLFPESVPGRVLKSAHQAKFVLHLSPLLLDETRYALLSTRLRDAYGHSDDSVLRWCAELEEVGRLFAAPLPEIGPVCRDPNDDHVIATALAVSANIIVTGDKDLLALSRYQSIRILSARAFLMELGD